MMQGGKGGSVQIRPHRNQEQQLQGMSGEGSGPLYEKSGICITTIQAADMTISGIHRDPALCHAGRNFTV